MDSLISVIIPVYQGEKTICSCIQSVQRQTYTNIEIIVINDGSTDKTRGILKKLVLQDNRVRVFEQENQGVSEARNKGIEYANGEYVMFVDSDDEIELELCHTLITTIKEQQVDLVVCGSKHVRGNEEHIITNTQVVKYNKIELLDNFELQCNTYIYQNVWGKLYRANLIKKCKFMKNIRLGEDLLFNFDYFKYLSSICVVPYIGYRYINNLKSATHKFNDADFEGQKLIRKRSKEFYHDILGGRSDSQVIENVYVGNCLGIILSLIINENFKNIIKNLDVYLNDDLFCEKLQLYIPHNNRFKLLSFLVKKKQYYLLLLIGKFVATIRKFK